jgi:hypothetical protein
MPLLVLIAATLASYPLGLALGSPWLLPLLNAAPAYTIMTACLRRGDRAGAVRAMLVWAACLAIFGTVAFSLWPLPVDGLVLHGPAYRDEMFLWIRTGAGSEGHLQAFLPQHLLHLAAFVALSLATASLASILMGSVLMNYMAFYVASLARAGVPVAVVVLLGWQPYALSRIAAFCVLGAVLAEPVLSRVWPYPYAGLRAARPYVVVAAGLILADWVIKAAVAPTWGLWLRRYLG